MPARLHLVTGAAGLGYVIAAAVENMGVLGAPWLDGSVAEIRAAYADQALGAVTMAAGALSLLCYLVFAAGMFRLLRRGGPWALAALAGGLAGPAVAAVGLVSGAALVGGGLSDATTRTLFDLHLHTRMAAGALMALVLLGIGIAGLRSRALPAGLSALAFAAAAPLALGPAAAITGDHALGVAAVVAFGVHTVWIWLASLWLTCGGVPRALLVRRAAFLMLALAAGLVGIAMLAVPRSTGAFFAWDLKPEGLAAFAGGVYVGSAAVYAAGLRVDMRLARPLVLAAVVLSTSVLTITLVHLEVFDLGRLQAWAWLALFAGFALVTTALAVAGGGAEATAGPRLPGWARAVFAVAAAAMGTLGLALWIEPAGFDLPPLGGRFAGSWVVMLAVLAGWAAAGGSSDEARLPAFALVALPAGALVAGLRTSAEFGYLAPLAATVAVGLVVLAAACGYRAGGWSLARRGLVHRST